ncbi:hypothetical protein BOTCAL_0048g00130 [Botryotinia calthae]|uniref:Serine hydrolase domain-containing protein n=1 Tax=Botryotinia calthae TaxID=38488 RepID=A0A4Y8DDN8_9HELO|nr:hypothetical protein BOTCAL_0048g00130 [Botryotinia calthae]
MRFLCLHGAGTNSQIFEFQTASLRHELGGDHVYEFVDGLIPCEPFAGMSCRLQDFISSDSDYLAYYEPNNSTSFSKAKSDLKTYIDEEGPFDGVIAFSQGSSLAAVVMIEQHVRQAAKFDATSTTTQPFRCAVFLSARLPYVDAGYHPQCHGMLTSEELIVVPTVHIWGAKDKIEPDQHLALSKICKRQTRYIFVHGGEHEVPGPRDKDSLTGSVRMIKKMLTEVECS